MSTSKKSRVKRVLSLNKTFKRRKTSDALQCLMADFGGRCSYSMQHHSRAGRLEVDHFNPNFKKDLIQHCSNLFPASRHCNGVKSNHWPTQKEQKAGLR